MSDQLYNEINGAFVRPIVKLRQCQSLSYLYKTSETPFFAVWFQAKSETEITAADTQATKIYQNLSVIGRREFFQFTKDDRVGLYRIYDEACAKKFNIAGGQDSIIFMSREDADDKIPTALNTRTFSLEGLSQWMATAINDVQRVFSKRVAYSVMHDQTDVVILIRNGGRPQSEEDFDEMPKTETRIVNTFNAFLDKMKFKQQ